MKSSAHGLESDGYVTTRDRDTARDSESDDVVSERLRKITFGRSNVETGTSRRARTVPPTGSDSDESEDSVKQVRSTVCVIPVLTLPRFDRPFILTTDASTTGIAYILSQKDESNREQVVCYEVEVLDSVPSDAMIQPEVLKATHDGWYTIEKILKQRKHRSKTQYLVKWEGSDTLQWCDRENVTDYAIQMYLTAKKRKKRKNRR